MKQNSIKKKSKKIILVVGILVLILLGANVYATTQGYDNIFFMIKNISTKSDAVVSNKEAILKDRDITISYTPIEIANGISIQFNNFIVKDNKATLKVRIDEKENVSMSDKISSIEIENSKDNSQLVNAIIKTEENLVTHTEDIEIGFFNDEINILKVNINSAKSNLATIEIDLNKKEINVLSNSFNELEKISEVELKETLSNYALLNLYNDRYQEISEWRTDTKEQFINQILVEIAMRYIYNDEFEKNDSITFSAEKVNKVVKEITGIDVKDHLDIVNGFFYYDASKKAYDNEVGDGGDNALCVNVKDITFENGIYTVTYWYCYPSENDYIDNTIDKLAKYESTLQFKLNNNYQYSKFCIVSDVYNLASEEATDSTSLEIVTPPQTDGYSENILPSTTDPLGFIPIENIAFEYRYSYNIQNYKDFNYDLDNDGITDKITIRKDKNSTYNNYLFELNGNVFTENGCMPEIYIVDFNSNDNYVEVVIFDNGPSDDLEYSIYRKNGNNMQLLECLSGSQMVLDRNGNFKVNSILTSAIIPRIYDKVYSISRDNKIYSSQITIDQEYKYTSVGNYLAKDLKYIDKAFEYMNNGYDFNKALNKAGIIELNEHDVFKLKEIISDTRGIVEYNGEEYYIFTNQGNFAD